MLRPRQGTSVLLVEKRGLEAALCFSHALPCSPRHLGWALGGVLSQSWFGSGVQVPHVYLGLHMQLWAFELGVEVTLPGHYTKLFLLKHIPFPTPGLSRLESSRWWAGEGQDS